MKRAKKLMMLLLAVVLVSGCTMKEEVNMNIKDDKSVDLAVIVALDDELIDSMLSLDNQLGSSTDKEFTDEERWEFIEETFNSENSSIAKNLKGEKYEEGKFKGKNLQLQSITSMK